MSETQYYLKVNISENQYCFKVGFFFYFKNISNWSVFWGHFIYFNETFLRVTRLG